MKRSLILVFLFISVQVFSQEGKGEMRIGVFGTLGTNILLNIGGIYYPSNNGFIDLSFGKAENIINKSAWDEYNHFTLSGSYMYEITNINSKHYFFGGAGIAISPFKAVTYNGESAEQTFIAFFVSGQYIIKGFIVGLSYYLEKEKTFTNLSYGSGSSYIETVSPTKGINLCIGYRFVR